MSDASTSAQKEINDFIESLLPRPSEPQRIKSLLEEIASKFSYYESIENEIELWRSDMNSRQIQFEKLNDAISTIRSIYESKDPLLRPIIERQLERVGMHVQNNPKGRKNVRFTALSQGAYGLLRPKRRSVLIGKFFGQLILDQVAELESEIKKHIFSNKKRGRGRSNPVASAICSDLILW